MSAASAHSPSAPLSARLIRGVVGGVLAGVVFILLNIWFVTSVGNPALAPFNLISSIVLGQGALPDANPLLGAVLHFAISIGYGVVFALLTPWLRTHGTLTLGAVLYGIVIWAINFLIIANTVLPQFQNPNVPVEFMAHALFGYVLALAFHRFGVRADENAINMESPPTAA